MTGASSARNFLSSCATHNSSSKAEILFIAQRTDRIFELVTVVHHRSLILITNFLNRASLITNKPQQRRKPPRVHGMKIGQWTMHEWLYQVEINLAAIERSTTHSTCIYRSRSWCKHFNWKTSNMTVNQSGASHSSHACPKLCRWHFYYVLGLLFTFRS